MSCIRAKDDPQFVDTIRRLAMDDGGDNILDRVDIVTERLLNNAKAALNAVEKQKRLVLPGHTSCPWTPSANKGAIWVKNEDPTTLWFTDSAGDDHEITNGGGGGESYWSRVAGVLSPRMANDVLDITGTSDGERVGFVLSQESTDDAARGASISSRAVGTSHGILSVASSSSASSYGLYGEARASSGVSYGVYGHTSLAGTAHYGGYFDAEGAAGTNYGIYAKASGATTNWAGYFDGNVTVDGKLYVTGLIDPTGLVMDQQNACPWTPESGKGALWIKDDNPTTLYYTDSDGVDHDILGGMGCTLDQAYDHGGPGAGRIITADHGAVFVKSGSEVDDWLPSVTPTFTASTERPSGQTSLSAGQIVSARPANLAISCLSATSGNAIDFAAMKEAFTEEGAISDGDTVTVSTDVYTTIATGYYLYDMIQIGGSTEGNDGLYRVMSVGGAGHNVLRVGTIFGGPVTLADESSVTVTYLSLRFMSGFSPNLVSVGGRSSSDAAGEFAQFGSGSALTAKIASEASAGSAIVIDNAGTGNDISASKWSVSKAGRFTSSMGVIDGTAMSFYGSCGSTAGSSTGGRFESNASVDDSTGVYGAGRNAANTYGAYVVSENATTSATGIYGRGSNGPTTWGGSFLGQGSSAGVTVGGVRGEAAGNGNPGTVGYGLYGKATGSETNWAGWFDGDVMVDGKLTVTGLSNFSVSLDGYFTGVGMSATSSDDTVETLVVSSMSAAGKDSFAVSCGATGGDMGSAAGETFGLYSTARNGTSSYAVWGDATAYTGGNSYGGYFLSHGDFLNVAVYGRAYGGATNRGGFFECADPPVPVSFTSNVTGVCSVVSGIPGMTAGVETHSFADSGGDAYGVYAEAVGVSGFTATAFRGESIGVNGAYGVDLVVQGDVDNAGETVGVRAVVTGATTARSHAVGSSFEVNNGGELNIGVDVKSSTSAGSCYGFRADLQGNDSSPYGYGTQVTASGFTTSTVGVSVGVDGQTGVYGASFNVNSTSDAFGIGVSVVGGSSQSFGVSGSASSTDGISVGVGITTTSQNNDAYGVYQTVTSVNATSFGCRLMSIGSAASYGGYFEAQASSGDACGVYAKSRSTSGDSWAGWFEGDARVVGKVVETADVAGNAVSISIVAPSGVSSPDTVGVSGSVSGDVCDVYGESWSVAASDADAYGMRHVVESSSGGVYGQYLDCTGHAGTGITCLVTCDEGCTGLDTRVSSGTSSKGAIILSSTSDGSGTSVGAEISSVSNDGDCSGATISAVANGTNVGQDVTGVSVLSRSLVTSGSVIGVDVFSNGGSTSEDVRGVNILATSDYSEAIVSGMSLNIGGSEASMLSGLESFVAVSSGGVVFGIHTDVWANVCSNLYGLYARARANTGTAWAGWFDGNVTVDGGLTVSGGYKAAIKTVSSATYDVDAKDYTILLNGSSNGVQANLPAASGNTGKIYRFKAIDISNTVKVAANGSDKIDGASDYTFTAQYEHITVQCNGAGWWIV